MDTVILLTIDLKSLLSFWAPFFQIIKTLENPVSSLGRYVFGSEISYNKAPPRLPGLGC